jgi:hypothetical protein
MLTRPGFHVLHQGGDGHGDNFWAIPGRDQLMLKFKHITPEHVTNGPPGTPTSSRMIRTHCTQSSWPAKLPYIGNWLALATD